MAKTLFSKLISKLNVKSQALPHAPGGRRPQPEKNSLKLMFFIVDWERIKAISGVFDDKRVGFYFVSKGRGTASSEIVDLLGIGISDKALITCLEHPSRVQDLLKEVRKNLGSRKPGAGIAFTVPLSGINSPVLRAFTQAYTGETAAADSGKPLVERRRAGDPKPGPEFPHALIISVINRGHSDEFMNTARKAGASGGTVLNARGQAHEGAVKFFGISVQEERELIIILANREKREGIMRALNDAHGLGSKTQGVVFSLPVDRVMSLSFEQDFNN